MACGFNAELSNTTRGAERNFNCFKRKLEHQAEHATFLDLDMAVEDNIFVYKLFDKKDKFPFFIVRMPYLSSNIPSSIFYGSIVSEFLRIVARCTL